MIPAFGGKIPVALGIGATAARHALDVEIGVRIPDPQPGTLRHKNLGVLLLIHMPSRNS